VNRECFECGEVMRIRRSADQNERYVSRLLECRNPSCEATRSVTVPANEVLRRPGRRKNKPEPATDLQASMFDDPETPDEGELSC
jgi:hypothetical protein